MFKRHVILPSFKQNILKLYTRNMTSTNVNSNYSEKMSTTLLNSKKATSITNVLMSYGFNKGQIKHIFHSPLSILSFSEKDIISNLMAWQEYDVNNKLLTSLTRSPELLTLTPEYITNRKKELMTLFTRKDINKLLVTCPELFLDDFVTIREKVEYIVHNMGVEQNSIVKSEALQFNFVHIKCRHLFISRAGFYKVNKKAVQIKTPPLSKIFSRNMKTFLKLSGLTKEEYNTFVVAYKFEEREKLEDEVSDYEN